METKAIPELAVQKFLRNLKSDEDPVLKLSSLFAISAKRHPEFENLILFKYDQVQSPFEEELVQDCRGIILDQSSNWDVVAMAFRKFFNFGEKNAAEIDWSTAVVQEKVDGSLCVMYHYKDEWHVATSGNPSGGGNVHGKSSFAKYFWDVFRSSDMEPPKDKNVCIYFELTGPMNQIVIQHQTPKLTVLGARRIPSLHEESASVAATFVNAKNTVKEFPLRSFEEITRSFTSMDFLTQEGYVVVDARWRRVKVKHPGYVALHHSLTLKGVGKQRALVNVVRTHETPEVLACLPRLGPTLADLSQRYERLVADMDADYTRATATAGADDKSFSRELAGRPWVQMLFLVRKGRVPNIRTLLRDAHVDTVVRLLHLDITATAAGDGAAAAGVADGEGGDAIEWEG